MPEKLTLKSKSSPRLERIRKTRGIQAEPSNKEKPPGNGDKLPPSPKPTPPQDKKVSLAEKARPAQRWLFDKFPKVFAVEAPLPLKIGIDQDMYPLQPEGMTNASVKAALKLWTSAPAYRRAVAASGSRYDLEGKPVGEVDERAVEHANKKLEKANAK